MEIAVDICILINLTTSIKIKVLSFVHSLKKVDVEKEIVVKCFTQEKYVLIIKKAIVKRVIDVI